MYLLYNTKQDVLSLPWQLKDYREFNPHKPLGAVYMLVNKETRAIEYIGQTSNIGFRLMPSVHHVYTRSVHDVYIIEEHDRDMRHYLESRCIALIKPKQNINRGIMVAEEHTDAYHKAAHDAVFG